MELIHAAPSWHAAGRRSAAARARCAAKLLVGIGLLTTRERLRQVYDETNQRCAILDHQPHGGLRVELTLPFRATGGRLEARGWRFEVPHRASDVA